MKKMLIAMCVVVSCVSAMEIPKKIRQLPAIPADAELKKLRTEVVGIYEEFKKNYNRLDKVNMKIGKIFKLFEGLDEGVSAQEQIDKFDAFVMAVLFDIDGARTKNKLEEIKKGLLDANEEIVALIIRMEAFEKEMPDVHLEMLNPLVNPTQGQGWFGSVSSRALESWQSLNNAISQNQTLQDLHARLTAMMPTITVAASSVNATSAEEVVEDIEEE